MLLACLEALGPDHTFAVDPRAASVEERNALGLRALVSHPRIAPAVIDRASRVMPGKMREEARERYGVVVPADVDAVLDASGFTYSDQFELRRTRLAAQATRRHAAAGVPTVLLPQALGPFTEPRQRREVGTLFAASRMVFARDRASHAHALAAGCPPERLALAPDFTCLVPPIPAPKRPADGPPLALIVPSAKILSHAAPAVRARYLPFLADLAGDLDVRGFEVQLLQHEQQDEEIVAALAARLTFPTLVADHPDPRVLKGVIGSADLVAGSRFHALVSAVCQGVPAVAVGWSHKYEALFEDYGVPEFVIDITDERGAMATATTLCDPVLRASAAARLTEASVGNKRAADAMWATVREILGCD